MASLAPGLIETVFATNYLGQFLLTHELYPLLQKAEQAQVINVSSNSHAHGRINLADPGYARHYHGLRSYGQSRLANLYFTFEFERQKPDKRISVYAVSPGLVNPDIGLKPDMVSRPGLEGAPVEGPVPGRLNAYFGVLL